MSYYTERNGMRTAIEKTYEIRKILITGGCWTTVQSRRIHKEYAELNSVQLVADKLGLTPEFVTMNLPYEKVVYDLKDKSRNAKRIERWRKCHKLEKYD